MSTASLLLDLTWVRPAQPSEQRTLDSVDGNRLRTSLFRMIWKWVTGPACFGMSSRDAHGKPSLCLLIAGGARRTNRTPWSASSSACICCANHVFVQGCQQTRGRSISARKFKVRSVCAGVSRTAAHCRHAGSTRTRIKRLPEPSSENKKPCTRPWQTLDDFHNFPQFLAVSSLNRDKPGSPCLWVYSPI